MFVYSIFSYILHFCVTECPVGYGWVNGECVACPRGYYKPGNVVADECIICPDPQSTTANEGSNNLFQCSKSIINLIPHSLEGLYTEPTVMVSCY